MQSDPLKIIVEANIPFIKGLLEPFATVEYLPPENINTESMREADALVTRTRTRCDASLLDGSRCRMIATATIGTDHIDLGYCRSRGIEVANAPGCNAPAVAQYVMASIISAYGPDRLSGLTLGIVGVGHVGRIVEQWTRQLGFTLLLNDPPRAEREGSDRFVSLDEIARNADIITFHTPHTTTGPYATRHLADEAFFASLRRKPMIINSARGPIVDNAALLKAIETGLVGKTAIDCWENEPAIDRRLLEKVYIATPHIAGYSHEGKIRATQMALEAIASHFGFPTPHTSEQVSAGAAQTVTARAITDSYDPLADTAALRANPDKFEQLRNHYDLRHEVS